VRDLENATKNSFVRDAPSKIYGAEAGAAAENRRRGLSPVWSGEEQSQLSGKRNTEEDQEG